MSTKTINVMLPREPDEGQDPLGDFLGLQEVRDELAHLGLDPHDPTHVERDGVQSLNIHFPDDGQIGFKVSALLNQFRGRFGYTTGLVVPYEPPPDNLPPGTVIPLAE